MTARRRKRGGRLILVVVAAAVVAVVRLMSQQPAEGAGTPIAGDAATARTQLAALTVAPEESAPYGRDQWGTRWDSQGNSCDTREIVLRQQGVGWVDGPDCRPVCPRTGPACWTSLYDGVAVYDVGDLQIDHLVPIAEANRSGTSGWTGQQRASYYQDTQLLVAVTATSNTSKSDGDPARWKPPARGSWCWYATRWIAVKTSYRLTVDAAEVAALDQMLATCPGGA